MTLSTNFTASDFGGYKKYMVVSNEGETLYTGFSRRDCVDFWNQHDLSDIDFRIVGLI